MSPYLGVAIKDLLSHIITTWTTSWNVYDLNQWTLLPLLKGSMLIYMMMIATAYVKPRYRMMIELAFFVYYYISNDCKFVSRDTEEGLLTYKSRLRDAILFRRFPVRPCTA